jgi:hypothetical protein
MDVKIIGRRAPVKMRKISAVCGPHFINGAHIGFQIKELARLRAVHPVVILPLALEPFLFKIFWAHSEMW